MMSFAYNETYCSLAQNRLGDAFDFAVNTLKVELMEFVKMFLVSGMAHQFEIANPTYVAGKNGCEIARETLEECGLAAVTAEDVMYLDKSPEYWIGWSLAFYQWYSGTKYSDIFKFISTEELYEMYAIFHEEDVYHFVEIMNEKASKRLEASHLRRLRAYAGLSQSQLSKKAEVPLRQIQLFEQGQRDITKTQGETLDKLSKALHCNIEELLQ